MRRGYQRKKKNSKGENHGWRSKEDGKKGYLKIAERAWSTVFKEPTRCAESRAETVDIEGGS